MKFKNLIGATAWFAPLALLVLALIFVPNDELSGRDYLVRWIPAALVACVILVRWHGQSMFTRRWTWIAFTLSAALAGFAYGFNDDRLLALAMCVYCFAWAKSHFEKPSERTGTDSHSMLSYLPALIIVLGLPQELWPPIDQWQWSGLSTYAWAVLQHFEVPFLISEVTVEFRDVTWKKEVIFGGLFSWHTNLALSMLWLGFTRRPAQLSPLYAAAAIAWSFLTNFMRFCFSAWLITKMGIDAYQGWQFYAAGVIALTSSLFLFIATDKIIWVILYPTVPREASGPSSNPLLHLWNQYFSVVSNQPAGRPQE